MKNLANKITIARMFAVPIFLLLAYTNHKFLAFFLFVIACISDFLDGYIARNYNQISNFGKFMDPLADKVLVISAMCYFTDMQRMPGWVVAIVCFREFAVSGLRMLAAEKKYVIAAVMSGKVKTAVTMAGIIAMLLTSNKTLDMAVSIVIAAVTLYSGISYFLHNKTFFSEEI